VPSSKRAAESGRKGCELRGNFLYVDKISTRPAQRLDICARRVFAANNRRKDLPMELIAFVPKACVGSAPGVHFSQIPSLCAGIVK